MYNRREPEDIGHDPSAGTISPDRPPQFKSMCGFRCGWGCEAPATDDDDGDGGESDIGTASTKVDTMVQSNMLAEWRMEPFNSYEESDGAYENLSLSEISMYPSEENTGVSCSLDAASRGTSSQSCVPARGSVESMTPRLGLDNDVETDLLDLVIGNALEYHFIQTPLWLSPQCEHYELGAVPHTSMPERAE